MNLTNAETSLLRAALRSHRVALEAETKNPLAHDSVEPELAATAALAAKLGHAQAEAQAEFFVSHLANG